MVPKVPDVPKVPGVLALSFASRWFDPANVHRTFEPLIADWQREWMEASPRRRPSVGVRGLAAFICAVVVSSPSLLRAHAPTTVTNRVAVRMTRFIALTSMLLMIPFLRQMPGEGWRGVLLLSLLPSAITVVFPLSMVGAVDAIRRYDRLPPHVERALAAKLGAIALLFMIVFGGFVVPAGNQVFRAATTPNGVPTFGVRELNTYQLVMDPTLAAAQAPYTGGADRATRIQRELNNRGTLALVPVLLLWIRWRAIETGCGRWWSPLPSSAAVLLVVAVFVAAQFSGFVWERRLNLPAGAGHWLTVIAFVLWGVTAPKLAPHLRHLRHLRYLRHPRF